MRSSVRRTVGAALAALVLSTPGCCRCEEEFPELPDFVRENRQRERCDRERERARERGRDHGGCCDDD
jgi:hypothetical protein